MVRFNSLCRYVLLTSFVVAPLAQGCGSQGEGTSPDAPVAHKTLSPQESFRYTGTGRNKKKVALGRREREQLAREADSKGQ